MTKLTTDPARQAHDAFRGYIYQVVRSVLVWIDLGDGEELYLEGAEDLDRIGPDGARVDQIKYTARRITLRTPSVMDAINNYWRHAKRNPHVKIRFRYLTTAAIGIERKRLTNDAGPALDQWNRARLEDSARSRDFARTLADDLAARASVDSDLRAYLAGASAASVREDLVCRIEWHAGEKDSASAIAEITDRLVLHGASAGLQPADSEAAFDALYRAAFEAAQDKSGPALNRAGFLRVFAAATAIQIPKQDLAALIRSAAALGTGSGIALTTPTVTMEGSPPLPARYFQRRQIETTVGRALADGTVLLHGATGTGKTLLAANLLKDQSALWLTLRDFTPREAKVRLALARDALGDAIKTDVLVVDDLDALSDPREIEAPLASLFNRAKQLNIRLILTSDRPLPPRLAQAAELSSDREFVMAPFASDEIVEFLRNAGCPEELEQAWSKILEAATMGHPQLLQVRISTLAEQSFPYPEARDLLGPTAEMDRVRVEARRLISALPDEARELLYRASLLTGRMQRQRLMAVGRFEPAIAETGHAIDILAGPWLEPTDDGDFRLSPLVRGSAEDARGQGWAKAMHRKLAWVYLIDRKLSPWDISSIVMHCIISGRSDPLAHVLQGIHSVGDKAWAEIAEACDFYISLGLKDALPFERPVDSFLFRVFQYRIAAARKPEIARQVAAKIDGEFAAFADEEPFRYFRFLFLSQFLGADAIVYPLATIVDRGLEFVRLAAAIFPDTPTFPDIEDEDQPPRVYFLTLRLTQMVQNLDAMTELLKIIAPLERDEAAMVLRALAPHGDLATLFTDRLWLSEMQSPSPRWARLCDLLRTLVERARALDVPAFISAAATTLIRTIDENLDDNATALAEAERLAGEAGDDRVFQCAMAVVIKNNGDIPRALALWREALPGWPREREDLGYAFAARQAAMAATKIGRWSEARNDLVSALDRLTDEARPTFVLGLKADSILCRYMMGEHAEAIADFGSLLDELDEMQAAYEEEPLRSVQRAIGGELSALANPPPDMSLGEAAAKLVGIPSLLEPLAGSATVVPVPLDFIRQHLIDLEARHGTNLELALTQASKVRATRFRALRSPSQSPLFQLALRSGDFSEVMRDALDAADALAAMAASRARGITNPILLDQTAPLPWAPTLDEFPVRYLIAALFGAAAADRVGDLPFARWRDEADAHPEGKRLRALVDTAEAFFIAKARAPWPEVERPAAGPWENLVLAALASTITEPMTPERLLACHVLWIHFLAQPVIDLLTANSVAPLIASQWRDAARSPALFINPRIMLPRLLAATDSENRGWSSTHRILSAALEGVRLAPDDPARQVIARLAEREEG